MSRTCRNIFIFVACVVAVWLIYLVGTAAYRMGTGLLLLYDKEAGQLTGSQLTNLTDVQRTDLLTRLHPRALAYAVSMTAAIVMLIATVVYSALCGVRVIKSEIFPTILNTVMLACATGAVYAIPPTVLGQPISNSSGIAAISAIAVLILAIFVHTTAWGIRRLFKRKSAA